MSAPVDEQPGGDFRIQASPGVAALQKLVLKHEEAFLVSDRRGDFPAHVDGELGFYFEGTRHLRWLELRLDGQLPLLLNAEISKENGAIQIGLTNADVATAGGMVAHNTIYVNRLLWLERRHLMQQITISNFNLSECAVTLEFIFAADFRDVFEVRGMRRAARGQMLSEERGTDTLRLSYRGLDDVVRATQIRFDPPPVQVEMNRAVYRLSLTAGASATIDVTATASNTEVAESPPRPREALRTLRRAAGRLHHEATRAETDNEAFNALLGRSFADLQMLATETPTGILPYAGVPWYVTPFGRDSVITALQMLPYQPALAAGTLRFLASWQGTVLDAFRDEEPGKIMHEYRRGEMANCREIPFIPYYGTIDATPLFVMLLAEYARWTGDLRLVRELWPAAAAALKWMRRHGDPDGDGYLEYAMKSELGLGNQGWKDSGDSVSHVDGTLAGLPIALAEVQGYAYGALLGGAELARLLEQYREAAHLRLEAEALRARFNRDFWIEDEGFYGLALDGDKRRCDVVSSNPGHCLWTGIVTEERAPAIAKRLLADDMFSGWGVRTLSAREARYNPMSYHNGSVWPHDNAIAAAGFRRYGLAQALLTIMSALFDASKFFEHARMPELFCGFPREAPFGPIAYPVACAPQAWAAGTPFQLLTAIMGLEPDAPGHRLVCDSPVLPPWLRYVELHNLRVGSASVDLAITRGREAASVEMLALRGDLELVVRR